MLTNADLRRGRDQANLAYDFEGLDQELRVQHEAALARLQAIAGPEEGQNHTPEHRVPRGSIGQQVGQFGLYAWERVYRVLDRAPWRRDQRDPTDVFEHPTTASHEPEDGQMTVLREMIATDDARTADTIRFDRVA